ncbi:hypothetical protein HAX54_024095 [Datura stramonium]|uniref:Cytochrome P450 n=1 Tax=Datura stramonium TaxID=4076 RepID=A0ABS8UXP0_DATST|nr:hypothetical protein [Datura stramonium]
MQRPRRSEYICRKIIEEHRFKRTKNAGKSTDEGFHDFVDVLLDLGMVDKLSDSDMIAVLWEMIFRGTDTVAILLEWILARMVLHPDIQAKVQREIDQVVGTDRAVSDSDLPNLPYLQAIVKETLRVHPPGPLLSWARLAIHDTCVGQQLIPAGTTAAGEHTQSWVLISDLLHLVLVGGFAPGKGWDLQLFSLASTVVSKDSTGFPLVMAWTCRSV